MTAHHDEAMELHVIKTVDEDANMAATRPPQICINLSPTLSRQYTDDTIDIDFPETPSPRRISTEFIPGSEVRDNQSNNPITDRAFLTPTIQRRGVSIRFLISF